MKKYTLSIIGFVISIIFYLLTIIFELEAFENFVSLMEKFEDIELDEIMIPILIMFIFAFFNVSTSNKNKRIEMEKVKIYKAMMSSTHHIMNNFLNQIQLLRMEAENTPGFDGEILELYNKTVYEATTQIKSLSSITSIDEETIKRSVAPKKRH